ncbi:hydroxyacylglutathione hydrolase [Thiothrix eikelboomii]|uniref:Hydroxyacylglutathione hydrolase n=1 Tax=Thiothrix eikelboomii TaxID=92487 RepID=A0A1T4VVC4_9GAMM|nr:hydroxyacylglutathione hydrolase [Thiothrix eikelboomii]SKA68859.1 hydroxyacylglutathione hydrolase [Thiothrix eikelboomii]
MIQVINIPAFADNYIWLITNEERKFGVIVDPGDAEPVLAELAQRQIEPLALLITHHHRDHVGGIAKLLEVYPHLMVYGPAHETIPHRTHPLQDGDTVELAELKASFQVLDVSGHTAGHIAYYGEESLFCGDTIFGCGCGRVFDGSLDQLHAALQRLAKLPASTLVYCAHEYTIDNIGFAKWVEPDNQDLDLRLEECWQLREAGRATVPFSLGNEFITNPFLRTHIPEVIAKAEKVAGRELQTQAEIFATLRIWKDTEYD